MTVSKLLFLHFRTIKGLHNVYDLCSYFEPLRLDYQQRSEPCDAWIGIPMPLLVYSIYKLKIAYPSTH